MATILTFPTSASSRRPVAGRTGKAQAAIIIFPGVRREALEKASKVTQATSCSEAKPLIQ